MLSDRWNAPLRVAVVLVVLTATPSFAQFTMVGDPLPLFEWQSHVSTDFRTEFETKSDGGDEFDAWRLGVSGGVGGPINQSVLLGFSARYSHASYDINLDNGVPATFGGTRLPREPWNTLNTIDFLPTATVLVGNQVSVVAAVPIRWAAESGANENGFAAGISALVRWQPHESISLGAGIGFTSQLEGNIETFPLVALRWRISESVEFLTEGDWFQGGRATLLWGPSESIRLSISGGYERTRFRLDEHGNAPDRDGIGEITSIPLEVGVRFQFMRAARLDVYAGLGIAGRLRVESSGGQKLYDQRYDTAPRVGFAITIPIGQPRSAAPPSQGPPVYVPDAPGT